MQLRPHQTRAFDSMQENDKGQIIVTTGGGKTYIMIADTLKRFKLPVAQTTVVVAPRILLANQLCAEFLEHNLDGHYNQGVDVAHVHSGETHHFSTTNQFELNTWVNNSKKHILIFTTYHSLQKVVNAVDVEVDTIYFDEAHNGCGRHFHIALSQIVQYAKRSYFFTASPRMGRGVSLDRGMNNTAVYGGVLENVPAQELIKSGAIVPPKIVPFETRNSTPRDKYNAHEIDADNLRDIIDTFDDSQNNKILVAAPSSRVLGNMLGHTTILEYFKDNGYDVMHITSKFGAIINGTKVGREEFFDTLTKWGQDDNKRFVIFHYSILSEGINVPGLTHTVLLRNLPIIEMAQTIGRVIRVHSDDRKSVADGLIPAGAFHLYKKQFGQVSVPTGQKRGDAIGKRLQNVVNQIFVDGVPPIAYC